MVENRRTQHERLILTALLVLGENACWLAIATLARFAGIWLMRLMRTMQPERRTGDPAAASDIAPNRSGSPYGIEKHVVVSRMDFLSPFEDLVLTSILEAGQGSQLEPVLDKVRELANRPRISRMRIEFALDMLKADGCVYISTGASPGSPDTLEPRCYRVQFRGQQALDAATQRRGAQPASEYFHAAGGYGLLWDFVCGYDSRARAAKSLA